MAQDPQRREHTGEAGDGRPAAAVRAGSDVLVRVDDEQLLVGEVDLASVRSVLLELGARGSRSFDSLSPEGAIALLSGIVGIEEALESVRARALVRLEAAVKEDCLRREETPRQAAHIARSEASRALKESRSVAGRSLATCRRLVQSMPGMLTALAEGTLRPRSVHKVGSMMGPVPPQMRELVDEMLTAQLPDLKDCGTGEIADHVERILHSLDPEGAAERHRRAKQDRHVTITRADHGMATVRALIPGIDAARIRKGLSVAAEAARAGGDRRGHQQIMADLFADALVGRGDGIDPTTLDIGIVITDRSLLAPAHADAATIEGFGPVPYDHVREAMLRAVQLGEEDTELALAIRQLYADLDDGRLVAVEARSRAFPAALKRFLTLAHQACRGPFCDAPIRQMDHIVPWSQGGPTSLDNGNGLCGGDNQKESSGETVRVLHDEDGQRRTVEWTTRYGQKARRGGVNFDPVGTYRRGLRHQPPPGTSARSRGHTAAEAAFAGEPAGSQPAPPFGSPEGISSTPSTGPAAAGPSPMAEHGLQGEDHSTIYRAFDRLRLRITDLPVPATIIRPRSVGVDLHVLDNARTRGPSPETPQPPDSPGAPAAGAQ